MDTEIHARLAELKLMQQEVLRLLEHLAGKKIMKDDWLDTVAIKDLLGVTDRTILRWRRLGALKPVIMGGKCYYSKKYIMDLVEQGKK
ncbi:DNA-binding protein [Pedobacter frigiditerrae]|uniref:DNA-binding protein n=1 Tax=Pedobacter frigiditerrae TaxID=2530452 RepID=A0A4R0MU34_9SPHI|nr:helix-turn-helix domain-containing protein [Pedobacter frigiditerrae]TCC90605.1 DNA-binding protein [Pedobacter frigiditerrae]